MTIRAIIAPYRTPSHEHYSSVSTNRDANGRRWARRTAYLVPVHPADPSFDRRDSDVSKIALLSVLHEDARKESNEIRGMYDGVRRLGRHGNSDGLYQLVVPAKKRWKGRQQTSALWRIEQGRKATHHIR
jgi:hypothetical protein